MKRVLSFFVALLATTCLLAAQNNVITYTATEQLTETTISYQAGLHTAAFNVSIMSHTFSDGAGIITFSGNVTSIGNYAFSGCWNLTSVTIPNSVTSIGASAFNGCRGLTSIIIPNTVTTIGNGAFTACSGLISITIPNSVNRIGESAFSNCYGLTSITITNGITSIGNSTFYGCSSLTSIALPNNVTSLGNSAFYGCSSLTSITIPNNVTSIGSNAFYNCSNLISIVWNATNYVPTSYSSPFNYICTQITSFTFGEDVISIPNYLCAGMSNILSVTIPDGVTSIGNYAFQNCSGLTSVNIPNSVTSIGNGAFVGCSGLTSVNIPNSVTSIGSDAFRSCSGLNSVTIPDGVTSIGSSAFSRCSGLTSIVWNATNCASPTSSSNSPFYDISAQITSFIIGDGVTTIPNYLCYHMIELNSVNIPNSVTSIGGSTFFNCSGLTSITVESGNALFDSRENCNAIIETATNTLIIGCKNTIIPNSVTNISNSAFWGCSALTSITIPNSVTSIGNSAFSGCSALTSVTIPNSVTSIGNSAFYNVPNIVYSGSATGSPWGAKCVNGYVDGYLVYSDNSKTNLIICSTAANGSITIPNSVMSIGGSTFSSCSGLTSVTIGNGVTSIGNYAFNSCSQLQTIYIHPTTLPTLGGNSVFYNVPTSVILYVPTESKSAYQANSTWNRFTTIRELHDVTVGGAEWASLCLPYNAEIPEEVTIYQGHVGNGYVSLSEIEDNLPANTGCVINAPAGIYTFLQTTETPAVVQNNDIHGVTINTEYSSLYDAQAETLLTLGLDDDDHVGFRQPNTTYSPQMEAYKAYILYPGVAQAPLRILMPGESNPIATGCENAFLAEDKTSKAILNGQLVIVRGGHHYDLNGKVIK